MQMKKKKRKRECVRERERGTRLWIKCAKEKKGLWIRRGCYETNREYLLLPRVQVQIDMLHEQNGESFYGLL